MVCKRLKRNGADMPISIGRYATPFVGINLKWYLVETKLYNGKSQCYVVLWLLCDTMIAMCNNDGKQKRFICKAHGHTWRDNLVDNGLHIKMQKLCNDAEAKERIWTRNASTFFCMTFEPELKSGQYSNRRSNKVKQYESL